MFGKLFKKLLFVKSPYCTVYFEKKEMSNFLKFNFENHYI